MPEMDNFAFPEHFKAFPKELKREVALYILSSYRDQVDLSRAEADPICGQSSKSPLM